MVPRHRDRLGAKKINTAIFTTIDATPTPLNKMQSTVFALVIGLVSSFNVAVLPTARRAPMAVVMGLAESAADCLEEGCSVDTVDSLVSDLKDECVALNQQGLAGSPRNQQIRDSSHVELVPRLAPHARDSLAGLSGCWWSQLR